jgi:23S rRNA pseudouridine1911/1915/1917 synthase
LHYFLLFIMDDTLTYTFTPTQSGERLDKILADLFPEHSRSQWQRLIKEGAVWLDGQPVKASYRIEGGEHLTADLPPIQETNLQAEAIPLDIRYEDGDMVVVNKVAGMVVHPAAGHDSGTLVNAILAHCPDIEDIGGERRPGIVHRLDKETSGLVVVAKNERALRYLQNQFRRRTVHKQYLALVEGQIQPGEALIDAPIGRDPRQRKRMTVIPPNSSATAREARTHYRVQQYFDDFTLIVCRTHTGRTHQIRVHMAYAGYPLVGDKVYGRRRQALPVKRHFLHAAELGLKRPSDDQYLHIQAELPDDLQQIIQLLQ